MLKLSGVFKVTEVLKVSEERYSVGVVQGDTVVLDIDVGGGSGGNYTPYVKMSVNGINLTSLSQSEVHKLFKVFKLEEVDKEEYRDAFNRVLSALSFHGEDGEQEVECEEAMVLLSELIK